MPFSNMTLHQFKEVFLQALLALPRFLKNPIQGMKDLPDWEWPILLALQAALGLATGLLGALLSRSLIHVITSIVIAPVSALVVNLVLSGFFYYTFLFLFRKESSFRLISTHMLFASIPVLILNVASPIVPFIGHLGLLASAALLYVGFKENLHLNEKKLKFLVGGLVAIYVALVVIQMVRFQRPSKELNIRATPESLDILEQELRKVEKDAKNPSDEADSKEN
ncbi:hypothetical protein GW916_12515 [bacterium]|nr:hypothetical protein [bacterium]